ncbi:hypothetical protein MRX96_012152 [Rhipicephalus microplus]
MGDNDAQQRIDNRLKEDEHVRRSETDWRTNEPCSTGTDTIGKAGGYGVEEKRTINHRCRSNHRLRVVRRSRGPLQWTLPLWPFVDADAERDRS